MSSPCQSTADSVPGSVSTVACRGGAGTRRRDELVGVGPERELVPVEPQRDHAEAGAGSGSNIVCIATTAASGLSGGGSGRERPAAPPTSERVQHRLQLAAARRQLIHGAGGRRRQPALDDQARVLELAQSRREHVGPDPRQARPQIA